MRKLIPIAAALLAVAPIWSPPAQAHGPGAHAIIQRTEFGIPHITAADLGGLGYGVGFAFAQDNLCVFADDVLTQSGDRSRWFGPDTPYPDPLSPTPLTNLDTDVYHRALNAEGTVERLVATVPSRDARDLVRGYADGYNDYLRRAGVANLPDPTCRGAAWVRPITELDVWRSLYSFSTLLGTAEFRAGIAAAQPPTSTARRTAAPLLPTGVPAGSNGLAVGSAGTRGDGGLVFGNPHFPWVGPARFYQMHLRIPGRLDVAGIGVYGSPLVNLGHNQNIAWTHTVSTATRFTLRRLALAPGDPTTYLVDGQPRRMRPVPVSVPLLGGGTVTRTLYRTEYGPVAAIEGLEWTARTAYAVSDANADNLRIIDQYLAMDRARSIGQLRAAQDRWQGIPFINTIASDSAGTAYYADASVVPHLTDERAAVCLKLPADKALFAQQGIAILDGAHSDCALGTDPDAIEPGIFAPDRLPHLTRRDFVANSNDSPWLSNPAQPLSTPRIIGDTGTQRSFRTRVGLDMINRRLSGVDGLGRPGFDQRTTEAYFEQERVYSAELARADVLRLCRAEPSLPASDGATVDVRRACTALAAWDGEAHTTSRGEVLWREFWNRTADNPPWTVPFDPARPLTTPRGLRTDDPAIRAAFADAVQTLDRHRLRYDVPIGVVQRLSTSDGPIPLPGCGEGCYDAIFTGGPLTDAGVYPDVDFGSSFIMIAHLTPAGPRVRTVLTYGESANPRSPHHHDQTVLFSRGRWVTERFTTAEILTSPALSTTVV